MTMVFAHRGASKRTKENTLVAFRLAKELGADGVELDVRRTQDGAMAIHHDPYLADGSIICDTASSDLPHGVPDLASSLDECLGIVVNIEIKNEPGEPDFDGTEALADQVVALLHARAGRDRVLISSFHLPTIDRVRALDDSVPTAWLVERITPSTLDTLTEHGHKVLHPLVKKVTRDLLVDCHSRGIAVNTWTCDDPERAAELTQWGIDGICTNVPDVILTAVRSAG
jgi:glycerophosphoryl diester phosphodiesterase